MRKGSLFWILCSAFFLLSCASPQPVSSDGDVSSEIPSSSIVTSSSETSISSSLEKDEEGFIVLPDSYLAHEGRAHSFGADVPSKPKCPNMRLYLGDESVPVYGVYVNETHRWDPEAKNRVMEGLASVSISSGAKFTLAATWVIEGRCKILPSSAGIELSFDEEHRTVGFEIAEPGDYVIEFRGSRILHLFVHPYEESIPYNESNCLYFGPGVHNRSNDSRLSNNSTITLSSNQTVYLAEGSFVEGAFVSTNTSNVKILGKGFIDGSAFERNASAGSRFIPFDFTDCSGFLFSSFAVIDPAGWCFNLYFCHDFELNGVKIISSRSNGDGISLQSCKNAVVDRCFVRSYDDSIVVKNYPRWHDRSIEGATENIEVMNCLIWTDLAQCMEIGYETVGTTMRNIRFHDIVVLGAFHKAVLSIHNANNANIRDVRFENIVIENLQTGLGDGSPYLIEFTVAYSPTWSDGHKTTGLGDIDGIEVNGVRVLSGIKTPKIIIKGSMETRSSYPNVAHEIHHVALRDIVLSGQTVLPDYSGLEIAYADEVTLSGQRLS